MTSRPDLAVDDCWHTGGIGIFQEEVLGRLESDFTLLRLSEAMPSRLQGLSMLRPLAISRYLDSRSGVPFYSPSYLGPAVWSGPVILTIHDLFYLQRDVISSRVRRAYFRGVAGPIARNADSILTVSSKSASDISEGLGVSRDRISLVEDGVSNEFWSAGNEDQEVPQGHRRGRLIYVGSYASHKRVDYLLRCVEAVSRSAKIELSMPPDPPDHIAQQLEGLRDEVEVVVRTHLSRQDLARGLVEADLLLLLSSAEGFGLTVVEAQAAGTPCVVADFQGAVERYGAHGAAYVPTNATEGEVARTILRVLNDNEEREVLRSNGRQNATRYTWEKVTGRVIEAIHSTI